MPDCYLMRSFIFASQSDVQSLEYDILRRAGQCRKYRRVGVKVKEIWPVLQIRKAKRDKLEIIFHICPLKRILCPSLEPSRRDGSNAGHNICFCWEIRKIIFE